MRILDSSDLFILKYLMSHSRFELWTQLHQSFCPILQFNYCHYNIKPDTKNHLDGIQHIHSHPLLFHHPRNGSSCLQSFVPFLSITITIPHSTINSSFLSITLHLVRIFFGFHQLVFPNKQMIEFHGLIDG